MSIFDEFDWKFFAIASALFASFTVIFGKLGVESISTTWATWIRTIVILVMITATLLTRGGLSPPEGLSKKSVLFLVISGLATGASWLCYYHALKIGPASKVAPLDKLSVAFAILLGWFFLNESINWKVLVGGTFIVVGSIFIAIS